MIRVIEFYETFTPCEVRILKLLVTEPRRGTYTDIARSLNIPSDQSSNVRGICLRLKDKGYIDIYGESGCHNKYFRISRKFVTEFMDKEEQETNGIFLDSKLALAYAQ